MKLLYFYTDEWEKEYIQQRLKGVDVAFLTGTINDYPALDSAAQAISVFVDSRVTAQILQQLPALKLIVARSVGFDHIDLNAARARGIAVCYSPTYATYAVAEYTFALMLACARKIPTACRQIQCGDFSTNKLVGFDLRDKTLGVVGTGNIGMRVAAMAACFGMKIVACDMYENHAMADKIGFSYVPFERLLAQSDVVTLHVSCCAGTYHLINRDNIEKFKRGACLVNTARGEVVQTEALVYALQQGILSGAALDVLEEEWLLAHQAQAVLDKKRSADELRRVVATQFLLNHPCVIATPHNAFNSTQARELRLSTAVQNIEAYVSGKVINAVP